MGKKKEKIVPYETVVPYKSNPILYIVYSRVWKSPYLEIRMDVR